MRRPVLALAAAFGLGCLLVDGAAQWSEAVVLAGLSALLLGLCLAASGGRAAKAALAAAALALGSAAAIVEGLELEGRGLWRLVRQVPPGSRPARLVGIVRGDGRVADGRLTFFLDVESVEVNGRLEPVDGRARVEVGGEWPKPRLLDGSRVAVWAALRAPRRVEGVRAGLAASGYAKSARLLEQGPGGAGPVRRWAADLRARAGDAFSRSMPAGTERGLVRAMVLGDRSEIDETTAEAFRSSGTYHVLALSGAQVALLAGLVIGALRFVRASPWTLALVTAVAIGFYSLFVGGDVPVVRAALMASAVLVGRALELDADAANLLGVAALVLLAHRPASAADVGFQLSFGATLGILALSGPLTRGVPRLPLRLDLAIAASIAAQCALAPILAGWFHRLAPAAVLLNIAAVPLSGAVLLAGLGVLVAAPLGPVPAQLAGDVAWVAAHALRLSGDLGPLEPRLDLRVAAPTFPALALHAAGLALLFRGQTERRAGTPARVPPGPGRGPALETGGRAAPPRGDRRGTRGCSPAAIALRARPAGRRGRLAGLPLRPRGDPRGPAPVARGRASSRRHRRDARAPRPRRRRPFLLHAFRVDELWEGPAPLADPAWRRVDAALREGGAARVSVAAGMHRTWDGVHMSVIGPRKPRRPPRSVRNEDSVVLDVSLGEIHLLLTGDVEGEAERWLSVPGSFVVKVPHHGSRSSSGSAFVASAGARLAVVSAGAHNPFGHPHPEVVERYRRSGALLLRTDRDGTVSVATDGQRVWVRTAGEGQERRIR